MDRTAATAVLFVTVLAVGFAAAAVGVGAVGTQDDATPDDNRTATADRTITVGGQGSAEAPPDQAVVSVAVVAEGDDPASVRDELAAGADALRRALGNESVPGERVATTEFRIEEPPRPPSETPDGAPDEPAYRGVHGFQVTVDDVDRAGRVIDGAAGAGADVRHVGFELSAERRADLRDRALTEAMGDARRQADTLAAAGDLRVTGVRRVDATDRGYGPVAADEAALADAGGETLLQPDDVTVRVDLRVTYDAEETAE